MSSNLFSFLTSVCFLPYNERRGNPRKDLRARKMIVSTSKPINKQFRPRGLMAKALDFGSPKSNSLEILGSIPSVVASFFFIIYCKLLVLLQGTSSLQ